MFSNLVNDSPSSAEKIGIVPSDPSKMNLDENDWIKVKEQYIKREDFKEPCVICKESLGSQQQVGLCSAYNSTFLNSTTFVFKGAFVMLAHLPSQMFTSV